jgi:hypothetical protein
MDFSANQPELDRSDLCLPGSNLVAGSSHAYGFWQRVQIPSHKPRPRSCLLIYQQLADYRALKGEILDGWGLTAKLALGPTSAELARRSHRPKFGFVSVRADRHASRQCYGSSRLDQAKEWCQMLPPSSGVCAAGRPQRCRQIDIIRPDSSQWPAERRDPADADF